MTNLLTKFWSVAKEWWKMAKGDKRKQTMEEYNARLKRITDHLNALYEEAEPLREEYYKIMAYFRTMKARGYITEEEYQEKVAMFKYLGRYTTRTHGGK